LRGDSARVCGGGMKASVSDAIMASMWTKFVGFVSIASVSTLCRSRAGVIAAAPASASFVTAVIESAPELRRPKVMQLAFSQISRLTRCSNRAAPDERVARASSDRQLGEKFTTAQRSATSSKPEDPMAIRRPRPRSKAAPTAMLCTMSRRFDIVGAPGCGPQTSPTTGMLT
jgi:hypothetical protein